MSTPASLYLISYDISCPQRRRRVQKAIKGICRRSQLSVFLCRATPARIRQMENQRKRAFGPTCRWGSGNGVMPGHERWF